MNRKSGKAVFAVIILMLVLSVLPMGNVLASNGSVDVSVTVMNNTVGPVSLRLTGEGGSFWLNVSASGMGKVMVPEGKYKYYLSTPCGGKSGKMNINVAKVLNASCDESPDLTLKNRAQPQPSCSNYEWWVNYYKSQYGWWYYGSYARGWTPDFYLTNYYYYYYFGFELRCTDGDPTYDPTKVYWD